MSAWRVAAGAVVLALWLPGAAHAQQGDGRPAVGGGSFNDAPLLAPGRYTDSVRVGERVYYAFTVKGGQRLHIRAIVPGDGAHVPAEFFAVDVWSPLRDRSLGVAEDLSGQGDYVMYTDQQIDFRTDRVDTLAAARAAEGPYTGPGAWYVSFHLPSGEQTPTPEEVPVDFEVEVEGTPLAEPAPRSEIRTERTAPPPVHDQRAGVWVPGLLVGGLAGLLAGLGLALALRARSRAHVR